MNLYGDTNQQRQTGHETACTKSYVKKAKTNMKDEVYMRYYNKKEPLYLDTDASVTGLGAGLLQVRDGLQFP